MICNNILITFNMLVDTDIGLINVVKEKYNDPSVFDNDILNLDDNKLKGLLQFNYSNNPLTVIMKDNMNIQQADLFFTEFVEVEYETILKKSVTTTMVNVIIAFITSTSIKVNIVCYNDLEADYIRNVMNAYNMSEDDNYKIIIVESNFNLDVNGYDTLYIKYLDDLVGIRDLSGKNIIISDYAYNLDPAKLKEKLKIPKREYVILYGDSNEFYTVTLYYYDESYYIEEKGE